MDEPMATQSNVSSAELPRYRAFSTRDLQRLHLFPPEELKCVWMVAGVLTNRFCNRSFQCESCPLDRVLQADPVRH